MENIVYAWRNGQKNLVLMVGLSLVVTPIALVLLLMERAAD